MNYIFKWYTPYAFLQLSQGSIFTHKGMGLTVTQKGIMIMSTCQGPEGLERQGQ